MVPASVFIIVTTLVISVFAGVMWIVGMSLCSCSGASSNVVPEPLLTAGQHGIFGS